MKERFNKILNKIKFLNYKINPTLLASSLAFYLLLTIAPFIVIICNLLIQLGFISNSTTLFSTNNFFNSIILIINLLWSSSSLTNDLLLISDVIYYHIEYRSRWKLRITAFFLTLLFLVIVIFLIGIINYFGYLKIILPSNYRFILNLLLFIFPFLFVATFIGIVYKYIIPVKIALKKTLKAAFIITSLLFIVTIFYQNVVIIIFSKNYQNIYGPFASIIFFLIWLYVSCYIFLIGISLLLLKDEYKPLTNNI